MEKKTKQELKEIESKKYKPLISPKDYADDLQSMADLGESGEESNEEKFLKENLVSLLEAQKLIRQQTAEMGFKDDPETGEETAIVKRKASGEIIFMTKNDEEKAVLGSTPGNRLN